MNYENSSNVEIACAVANKLGYCWSLVDGKCYVSTKRDGDNVINVSGRFDPCNNWSDIGPIMLENNIVLTPCMGVNFGDATGYFEHKDCVTFEFEDNSKALRAAAICFLMMEAKQ